MSEPQKMRSDIFDSRLPTIVFYAFVAELHRLEALRLLGRADIPATVLALDGLPAAR